MPKMVHPKTGGSFECPERQVATWRRSGWVLESEAEKKTRKPSGSAQTTSTASTESETAPPAGDNPEE